ncbi:hypothetical protein N3K63_09725 [Microbacterium sp. W1N]|uniref:hypothetical protein n=1 Tax=Microbacterium festucae TaxID=2977531 RepID=UPI0021BEDDD4|nr:hypothetical protein [Microbacterium festucae]MCT9820560.1 hypothetical protein [Microbacterium festucae]
MTGALPPPAGIDTVRKAIADLDRLWDRAVGTSGAPFRPDLDLRRAIGVHTHAHNAVQLARALLVLDAGDAQFALVPTVRAIFEMGVTAAWLLLTPGSGDSLVKRGVAQRKVAQTELIAYGVDATEALDSSVAALAELEDVPGGNFRSTCLALADGPGLYLTYRALSTESHAGLGIADAYFVETTEHELGIAFKPDAVIEPRDAYLGIAAAMLFLAVNADETARAKPHHSTQLRKIANRLGVSTEVVRADGTTLGPRPAR